MYACSLAGQVLDEDGVCGSATQLASPRGGPFPHGSGMTSCVMLLSTLLISCVHMEIWVTFVSLSQFTWS